MAVFILLMSLTSIVQSQTLVNKVWEDLTGFPDTLHWNSSTIDAMGQLLITGNSVVQPGETELLITKYNDGGDVLWQQTYQHNGNLKNYGTAITHDTDGNYYVTGATGNNLLYMDFLTLKLDSAGNILWAQAYDGTSSLSDIPSDIVTDNAGNVIVTGASQNATTLTDYLTVMYDNSGTEQWATTYDYTGLHDAAVGIELVGTDIIITGGSASSANNYDYTTIKYDVYGSEKSVNQETFSGYGIDNPHAMQKDLLGNLYITGKAQNGANIDIRTLKIGTDFSLKWAQTFDYSGLTDEGNDLSIDLNGNVFITGFCTNSDGGREFITIKYDSTGNELWTNRMQAIDSTENAEAFRMIKHDNGNVSITGTMQTGAENRIVTVTYNSDGKELWLQNYAGTFSGTDRVVDIQKDEDGNVYLIGVVTDSTGQRYATLKYEAFTYENEVVLDNDSTPLYMDNQILISFIPDSNSLIMDLFYKKGKIWGTLDEFVQPDAIDAMEQKLNVADLSQAKVRKVFRNFTPNDTLNTSRNGYTYRVPPFWATLLLFLPPAVQTLTGSTTEEKEVSDSLKTLRTYIVYAEPNWVGHTLYLDRIEQEETCFVNADDDHYDADQKSLHFNPNETDVHINPQGGSNTIQYTVTSEANISIEGAWDIETGDENIKIGIIDNGIRWKHPDLGGQFGEVITGGFNYVENKLASQTIINNPGTTHGTRTAGIIGAIRNNNKGVSGIAGGDDNMNKKGVSLLYFGTNSLATVIEAVADANTSWRCDVLNFSIGFTEYSPMFKRVIDYAHRGGVTLVAARGNSKGTSAQLLLNPTDNCYPATFPDTEILSVGASGFDGERKKSTAPSPDPGWESAYDKEMDVIAPGEAGLAWTTTFIKPSLFVLNQYSFFAGTSQAAPHVTGVVALLESHYLNHFKLSPEDNEYLIQRYAEDRDALSTSGNWQDKFDDETGFGLINATNTLNGLSEPEYLLEHHGYSNNTPVSTTSTMIVNNGIINVSDICENYGGATVNDGRYYVDIYEYESVFTYSNPSGMFLRDYWSRNSGVDGIAMPFQAGNGEYYIDCKTVAPHADIVANASTATMTTYILKIKDPVNSAFTQTVWFPTGSGRFHFSLYWKAPGTGITDTKPAIDFHLYPNPADKVLNIAFAEAEQETQLEIMDIQGKVLLTQPANRKENKINIAPLANGVYFLKVTNGQGSTAKVFTVK